MPRMKDDERAFVEYVAREQAAGRPFDLARACRALSIGQQRAVHLARRHGLMPWKRQLQAAAETRREDRSTLVETDERAGD